MDFTDGSAADIPIDPDDIIGRTSGLPNTDYRICGLKTTNLPTCPPKQAQVDFTDGSAADIPIDPDDIIGRASGLPITDYRICGLWTELIRRIYL